MQDQTQSFFFINLLLPHLSIYQVFHFITNGFSLITLVSAPDLGML